MSSQPVKLVEGEQREASRGIERRRREAEEGGGRRREEQEEEAYLCPSVVLSLHD